MVWILSITRPIIWSLFLLLFNSCSSGVLKSIFKKPKKVNTVKQLITDVGPTIVDNHSYFQEKTSEFGLSGYSAVHIYAVDFNNDSLTDLVLLPSHFSTPIFLQFDGEKFVELDYSPFKENLRTSYMLFYDHNKDGVLDVLKATLNQKTELKPEPIKIFLGKIKNGKVFYEYQSGMFDTKPRPVASIGLVDFNLDGNLDLYLGNWYKKIGKGFKPVPDELYEYRNGKYVPMSGLLDKEHDFTKDYDSFLNATPTFGVGICDVDLNGRPDIMTSSSSGYYNKMWLNLTAKKKISYKEYAKAIGYASDKEGEMLPRGGGNSFYSICTDYNNDGTMDILQGELFHAYDSESRDRSSILTGNTLKFPPQFYRTEFSLDDGTDSWTQGDRRGSWFDFNFDGLIDAIVDNSGFPPKSRLLLFEQLSDHAFADVGKDLGVDIMNPSGTVIVDINNDGKLDILTGQSNVRNSKIKPKLYLFVNQAPQNNRTAIRVYLNGIKSNTAGIGATIKAKTNETVQMRFVEYSNGSLPSQNEEGVFIGLGKQKLEQLEVTWPYQNKKNTVLKKVYTMKGLKLSSYTEITLCESGKFYLKKQSCK